MPRTPGRPARRPGSGRPGAARRPVEEQPVPRHRVVDPRTREDQPVVAAEGGEQNGDRHDGGRRRPQRHLDGGGADPVLRRVLDSAGQRVGAVRVAVEGQNVEVGDVGQDIEQAHHARCPAPSASGRFRLGFCTSAAAKVTLFQASLEKSEPTIAAPMTGNTARVQSPVPQKLEKLAAATSGRRKSVSPKQHQHRERADLGHAEDGLDRGASFTPRMLSTVSTSDHDDRHDALGRETELNGVGRPGQTELAQREEDVGRDAGHQDTRGTGRTPPPPPRWCRSGSP